MTTCPGIQPVSLSWYLPPVTACCLLGDRAFYGAARLGDGVCYAPVNSLLLNDLLGDEVWHGVELGMRKWPYPLPGIAPADASLALAGADHQCLTEF